MILVKSVLSRLKLEESTRSTRKRVVTGITIWLQAGDLLTTLRSSRMDLKRWFKRPAKMRQLTLSSIPNSLRQILMWKWVHSVSSTLDHRKANLKLCSMPKSMLNKEKVDKKLSRITTSRRKLGLTMSQDTPIWTRMNSPTSGMSKSELRETVETSPHPWTKLSRESTRNMPTTIDTIRTVLPLCQKNNSRWSRRSTDLRLMQKLLSTWASRLN